MTKLLSGAWTNVDGGENLNVDKYYSTGLYRGFGRGWSNFPETFTGDFEFIMVVLCNDWQTAQLIITQTPRVWVRIDTYRSSWTSWKEL